MLSRWKRRALIVVLAVMLIVPTIRVGAGGNPNDPSTPTSSALPLR